MAGQAHEDAARLSEDMAKARKEELDLLAAEASQQIVFKLPDAENATVHALRAIIAARAFKGKLLGCRGASSLASPPPAEDGAAPADPPPAEADKGTPEVELREVTEAAVQQAVDWAYTGRVSVSDGNWKDLLAASSQMGVEGIAEAVDRHFAEPGALTPGRAAEVLAAAHRHSAAALKARCLAVVDADWAGAACPEGGGFAQLPKDVLQEILARDTLRAGELAVFHAVVAWGKAQLARERAAAPPAEAAEGGEGGEGGGGGVATLEGVLEGVIDLVRFPLIPPEGLRDVVQPALRAEGLSAAERLVLEGYQFHALVKIGQPHNLPDAKRTGRWLKSLPPGAELVRMASMRLGEDDAVLLADWLRAKGGAVRELDLKCNSLSAAAVGRILDALPSCPRIEGLALGENPVGPGGGALLAAALDKLPGLRKLGAGGTRLGDEGVAALAEAAGRHPGLRVLGLTNNLIGAAAARELVGALAGGGVEAVALAGNRIAADEAAALQGACREGLALKF